LRLGITVVLLFGLAQLLGANLATTALATAATAHNLPTMDAIAQQEKYVVALHRE